MRPGDMHRNGHGQCGACLLTVDRCPGGRRARKAGRWTYTGPQRLGWVCESCRRWVMAPRRQAGPVGTIRPARAVDGPDVPQKALTARLRTRRRKARRKAHQAENRAAGRPAHMPDLDTLSPSAYRRFQLAERAREKRRRA